MKKIGIISLFYNSQNYGGVLQAYALNKVLSLKGYKVEQICYKHKKKTIVNIKRNKVPLNKLIRKSIDYLLNTLLHKCLYKKFRQCFTIREREFDKFRRIYVNHSNVYDDNNISSVINNYDIFICGSDQIWKPNVINNVYTLQFVPDNKLKFAYAASIARDEISLQEIENISKQIKNLDGISIRERTYVTKLQSLCNQDIEVVLDPTLLLSKDDWAQIIDNEPIFTEDYVFCYLLSSDISIRKAITVFSRRNKLKIVTLPFMEKRIHMADLEFGDYKLFNVGPSKFLSLIKNAKHIFTDSFHATVFSCIFEKDFYAFSRKSTATMNTRIVDLLQELGIEERFIDNSEKWNNIGRLRPINFTTVKEVIDIEREKSINYIDRQLKKVNNSLN